MGRTVLADALRDDRAGDLERDGASIAQRANSEDVTVGTLLNLHMIHRVGVIQLHDHL